MSNLNLYFYFFVKNYKFSFLKRCLFLFPLIAAGQFVLAQDLAFDWVMTAGSSRSEMAMGIHVDAEGYVYSTGDIAETVTFGEGGTNQISITANAGSLDAFICKQDSTGLVKWAHGIGGSGSDRGLKVKTDKAGDVYVLGYFSGTVDFDPGQGSEQRTANGGQNGFVLKLSKEGNFEWVSTFGGTPAGFDIDTNNNIYVTGYFSNTAQFGNNTLSTPGTLYMYVAKMDNKGQFTWSYAIGETGARGIQQQGLGLCVDAESNVIVTGNYSGTVDFNPGIGTNNLSSNASSADIFLLKLSSSGLYLWAKSIGNSGSDYGHALTADKANNIYITGYFAGTVNFNTGSGTLNLTAQGSMDGFVAKYDPQGDVVWAKQFGGTGMDQGLDIARDDLNNVYVTGFTNGDPTVDYSSNTVLPGFSGNDIIILKYNNSGDFQWAKLMGGIKPPNLPTYADSEVGLGIDIDRRNGAVYTVGYYQEFDIDFDPGPGSYIANIRQGTDIFIHKLHCPADTIIKEVVALCDRSYSFADTTLKESGEYVFYFRELGRCDSITILKLTLGTHEKPIIQVDERVLSTADAYKTYQWVLNGNVIQGAVNRSYTVLENGFYSVIVTHENGCIDTSDIYEVTNANNVEDLAFEDIAIYPNPTDKMLYIKSEGIVNFRLATIDGRVLLTQKNVSDVDLSGLAEGLYLAYLYDSRDLLIRVVKVYKR